MSGWEWSLLILASIVILLLGYAGVMGKFPFIKNSKSAKNSQDKKSK